VLTYLTRQNAAAEVAHLTQILALSPRRTRAVVHALAARGLVRLAYGPVYSRPHLHSLWVFLTDDADAVPPDQWARWNLRPLDTEETA
jgi:hypothetical protein